MQAKARIIPNRSGPSLLVIPALGSRSDPVLTPYLQTCSLRTFVLIDLFLQLGEKVIDHLVKYLDDETQIVHAAEYRIEGDWLHFYDEDGKAVAAIRGDKVMSITRAEDNPILAR
jgi:hypothetical protein